MDLPLDRYAITARLAPVGVVFLPLAFVAGALLGKESVEAGLAIWLGTAVVLTALFAHLGRDQGRKVEPTLFAKWGGPPTSAHLRHQGSPLNPLTRERVVVKLAAVIPGIRWPTREDEGRDAAAADRVYDSAVHFLREKTRDAAEFPLVFAENVSYGFRRNLWAMKTTGVVLSTGCSLALCARLLAVAPESRAPLWIALAACASLLALWMVRIRESWVRDAANAYAERLLGAVEKL